MVEPARRLIWRHEELHLHLLELPGAKDEVPRRDLVAEALTDLGDPERWLLAGELQVVLEVQEDALGRLGAEVDGGALVLDRPHGRLEHEVELPRLGQVALGCLARVLGGLAPAPRVLQSVGAKAQFAGAAVDQRIGEPGQVTAGLPGGRVLDDRRVQRDDVVALLQHRPPPLLLDVVLEQHPIVAVVVARSEPAIDLAAGEHEAPPLAERDDLVHRDDIGGHGAADGIHPLWPGGCHPAGEAASTGELVGFWHSRLESAKGLSYTS